MEAERNDTMHYSLLTTPTQTTYCYEACASSAMNVTAQDREDGSSHH